MMRALDVYFGLDPTFHPRTHTWLQIFARCQIAWNSKILRLFTSRASKDRRWPPGDVWTQVYFGGGWHAEDNYLTTSSLLVLLQASSET